MDLIPSDFRQARRARHFARTLGLACLVVAALSGLAWLGLQLLISKQQQQIVRLREQDGTSQRQQVALGELRVRKQQLEEQLATLGGLRGGERVARLLAALDASHEEGVWLESLRLQQVLAGDQAASAKAPPPAAAPAAPQAKDRLLLGAGHHAELAGHAVDHSRLANFMRTLGAQPGVTHLVLIDTKLRTGAGSPGVDFGLAMQVEPGESRP